MMASIAAGCFPHMCVSVEVARPRLECRRADHSATATRLAVPIVMEISLFPDWGQEKDMNPTMPFGPVNRRFLHTQLLETQC